MVFPEKVFRLRTDKQMDIAQLQKHRIYVHRRATKNPKSEKLTHVTFAVIVATLPILLTSQNIRLTIFIYDFIREPKTARDNKRGFEEQILFKKNQFVRYFVCVCVFRNIFYSKLVILVVNGNCKEKKNQRLQHKIVHF